MDTTALPRLHALRQAIYTTFDGRRDTLAEILDVLFTTSLIEHPVHLGSTNYWVLRGFP